MYYNEPLITSYKSEKLRKAVYGVVAAHQSVVEARDTMTPDKQREAHGELTKAIKRLKIAQKGEADVQLLAAVVMKGLQDMMLVAKVKHPTQVMIDRTDLLQQIKRVVAPAHE
jgi:hypothetical protein